MLSRPDINLWEDIKYYKIAVCFGNHMKTAQTPLWKNCRALNYKVGSIRCTYTLYFIELNARYTKTRACFPFITYLLTKLSPSWEAANCSATQEFPAYTSLERRNGLDFLPTQISVLSTPLATTRKRIIFLVYNFNIRFPFIFIYNKILHFIFTSARS
jgi:hypothetical protein